MAFFSKATRVAVGPGVLGTVKMILAKAILVGSLAVYCAPAMNVILELYHGKPSCSWSSTNPSIQFQLVLMQEEKKNSI